MLASRVFTLHASGMFTPVSTKVLRTIAVAFGGFLFASNCLGQEFTVASPTRLNPYTYSWTPLTLAGSGGSFLTDPTLDQQTGQIEDDFLGSATNPGFLIRAGQINGVDSVAFRLVENKSYRGTTFGGQASVGLDVNGDGALDIVFTAIGKNQSTGISYQLPGTGANVSPNTTSLGNPVFITGFTASNFDYRLVDAAIYPNYTQVGTDPDVVLTFALTFSQINTALAAIGLPPITPTTLVRFIAFTSTQTNAINQDIFGSTGIVAATRFDAPGGGFTEFTDFYGRPVPEPSTMVAVGGLLGAGLLLRRWRLRAGRIGQTRVWPPASAPEQG